MTAEAELVVEQPDSDCHWWIQHAQASISDGAYTRCARVPLREYVYKIQSTSTVVHVTAVVGALDSPDSKRTVIASPTKTSHPCRVTDRQRILGYFQYLIMEIVPQKHTEHVE